jgi:hypothetical protein
MFEFMLLAAAAIAVVGLIVAYDGSRDVFHPLVFIGPMLAFLYAWMPFQLLQHNALMPFFDNDELRFVQTLNILGILAFVVACLSVGVRVGKRSGKTQTAAPLSDRVVQRLLVGSLVVGSIGLGCWLTTIINVGGFTAAFSSSYSGGWDDSGYVRDGSLLLLVGVLLAMTSLSAGGPRLKGIALVLVFGLPWLSSALLMGRRGPTFALTVVLAMGWYFNRKKRPPLLLVAAGGLLLGWFVMFLVTNRSEIYIGSSFDMKTDVSNVVDKPDTGNEYIYGSGTILSAKARDHYFWMRRYLAQIMVRPIPSAIWPTKYEDFGVPELLYNAGTGEGFGDTLGWVGAVGSAPGIIADFWVEVWWFAVPLMALVGYAYGKVWKNAVQRGGPWASQYVILAALSIYLVMQTGEAVIFRTLLLSIPSWLSWRWAMKLPSTEAKRRFFPTRRRPSLRAPMFAPINRQDQLTDWKGSTNG